MNRIGSQLLLLSRQVSPKDDSSEEFAGLPSHSLLQPFFWPHFNRTTSPYYCWWNRIRSCATSCRNIPFGDTGSALIVLWFSCQLYLPDLLSRYNEPSSCRNASVTRFGSPKGRTIATFPTREEQGRKESTILKSNKLGTAFKLLLEVLERMDVELPDKMESLQTIMDTIEAALSKETRNSTTTTTPGGTTRIKIFLSRTETSNSIKIWLEWTK